MTILENININIDIYKAIVENISTNIDKDILENIDIDKNILENININIDMGISENINIDIDKNILSKDSISFSRKQSFSSVMIIYRYRLLIYRHVLKYR